VGLFDGNSEPFQSRNGEEPNKERVPQLAGAAEHKPCDIFISIKILSEEGCANANM
jgi:hypothetical protein